MSEIKTATIPWWVLLIIGAVIVVLFLKFCQSKKDALNDKIAAISAAVQATHIEDSIKYSKEQQILSDSAAAIKNRLSQAVIAKQASDRNLDVLLAENRRLIKSHNDLGNFNPIDTSATLVPAAFINDCKDCFTQLEKTTDSVEQYKYQTDQMQVLWISQMQIDSSRIAECDSARLRINKNYNDLRVAIELNAKSFQPSRKLKVGIAGRLDNQFLPSGVGPSLMYQDRKDRNFGFTPVYGSNEPAYLVNIHVPPFSF